MFGIHAQREDVLVVGRIARNRSPRANTPPGRSGWDSRDDFGDGVNDSLAFFFHRLDLFDGGQRARAVLLPFPDRRFQRNPVRAPLVQRESDVKDSAFLSRKAPPGRTTSNKHVLPSTHSGPPQSRGMAPLLILAPQTLLRFTASGQRLLTQEGFGECVPDRVTGGSL